MTNIKSYTDIKQSKKLSEILSLESADMVLLYEEPYETSDSKFDGLHQALCVPFSQYDKSWRKKYRNISYFPCWSLAALLSVLPNSIYDNTDEYSQLEFSKMSIAYHDMNDGIKVGSIKDNLVDACVEMIIKLHEKNLL